MTLPELPTAWRLRAEELKPYAPGAARAFQTAAAELERCMGENTSEPLTLSQAAAESGYSTDHLARLVRQGKLRNAGRQNAPLIRRGDLPRKPPSLPSTDAATHLGAPSSRQIVRAIATGGD